MGHALVQIHEIWGGGRVGYGMGDAEAVLKLMQKYGISARLTFSNSLLKEEHLSDRRCNELCRLLNENLHRVMH